MWRDDKDWADRYMEEIKRIVKILAGQIISVEIAPEEDDVKRATDMVVRVAAGAIAVRVRRSSVARNYGYDFTIRSRRDSGAETELAKILNGFARWYAYLWVDGPRVDRWVFVDLDHARQTGILERGWRNIPNGDGTYFIAVPVQRLIESGCVLAKSGDWLPLDEAA